MTRSNQLLGQSGLPAHEAARLLASATGHSLGEVRGGVDVTGDDVMSFLRLVERRLAGEPLQYLEGDVQFGPVTIQVDPRALIPRPETEFLYELAAGIRQSPRIVVDLCTGSGALALALKHRFPKSRVLAVDFSPAALDLARANGARLKLEVEWLEGSLWEPLPSGLLGAIDLVVANPPYIAEREWEGLPVDVRHEPAVALVAGPSGTETIEALLADLGGWLAGGGTGLIEVGEAQAEDLAARHGCEVIEDQYGRPRFLRISG
ncbi:MAG: HemK/PrmC family methyltransferase [Acidimicrobiia bacterium]|nr:HemK/PrmC family methyltransferase [Acidimicrobiia bacterium]